MENSRKKAAMSFIFITLLIDITGWGIIIPVVPKLIEELIHSDISEAAKYGGWLGFAYAFTQFIFSPVVGVINSEEDQSF
jgi:MFS transporter, DHA1 family, tetracycline resistance protein